jgi:hypothetical protein
MGTGCGRRHKRQLIRNLSVPLQNLQEKAWVSRLRATSGSSDMITY